MYYPDELVEEVRLKNDIVEVISSYVRLTKKGSNYFGLCPFHNEKSASFSVTPSKQMYYCFGCGAGGNVFSFIMEYENYSFSEALKFLADRAGVKLPENFSEADKEKESKRAKLLEVNKEAGKFYYALLRNEVGSKGMQYLKGRGLSDETLKRFGLGYARGTANGLYKYLKQKGYEESILSESGLFSYSEKGVFDKFWDRVMFPIMDTNHRIIGFGGRVMGDGEPKYLNSPETYIFDKGRNLYGLNYAKSSRSNYVILCEGYMDVISLHQAGFSMAVASLGTAFTSGQANLLLRYTENAYLCYDSDGAGVKAALRAIPILRQAGISAKVINMRPYKDPDEFIKNLGAEEFQKRIDDAENSFYYEVRMLEASYDLKDPESKTKFMTAVAKMILRFEEEIERENYIKSIADKYSVTVSSLNKLVAKYSLSAPLGLQPVREEVKSGVGKKPTIKDGIRKTEGLLLNWICDETKLYPVVSRYIEVNDFTDEVYHKVAVLVFEQIEKGNMQPAEIISHFQDEEELRDVAALFHSKIDYLDTLSEKEKALKDLIISVKRNSLNREDDDLSNVDLNKFIENKKKLDELEKIRIDLSAISNSG